jgi:hypothetical protein
MKDENGFGMWLRQTDIGDGQQIVDKISTPEFRSSMAEEVIQIHSRLSYGLNGDDPSVNRKNLGVICAPPMTHWQYLAQEGMGENEEKELDNEQGQLRFFFGSGSWGLAPNNAQVSDIICRFQYCNIVAVLRWDTDRYRFVGRAAVFAGPVPYQDPYFFKRREIPERLWIGPAPDFEPSTNDGMKIGGSYYRPVRGVFNANPIRMHLDAHTIQLLTRTSTLEIDQNGVATAPYNPTVFGDQASG